MSTIDLNTTTAAPRVARAAGSDWTVLVMVCVMTLLGMAAIVAAAG